MTKFVFVTGGVVSGLGKGITAASLGMLLKAQGYKVHAMKLDPYMNIDPGTMSPYQHGEVFVTDDGAETDLDLGHYERFMDENLTKFSNITSGAVFWNVLNREREGVYLGNTVQVIPHITQEIKDFIYSGAKKTNADILLVEIGGTVGDIESQPFIEAIRQISLEQERDDCLFIHVTLVPYLKASKEHKSKPTQHSVKELQSMGIAPGIIITRADEPIAQGIKDKIALFCKVKKDCVIENITLDSLYRAPIMLHESGLDKVVCRSLNLEYKHPDLIEWRTMIGKINKREKEITVAIVGKYVQLQDAYISVIEALNHAGIALGAKISIQWTDSEKINENNVAKIFKNINAMIIPGGFGNRGIEGKITACRYAREKNIPFLGICLGLQIAVIEFARNICGLKDANSSEFKPDTLNQVIHVMPDQADKIGSGGTMRLGAYPCKITKGTLLCDLYKTTSISERHRHRFEFHNNYREIMISKGLIISGVSPNNKLVETIELPNHPYFIAVQFHPEFKSRPNRPHPLFLGLVHATIK